MIIRKVNRNLVSAVILVVVAAIASYAPEIRTQSVVSQQISELRAHIMDEKWNEAAENLREVESAWRRRKLIVALNNSAHDIRGFDYALSQTKAAVSVKDKAMAIVQAAQLEQVWWDFGG